MPLPRCPACGSLIFPSARDGGDTSALCDACQERARQTGHAGPALRFAGSEVREEVIEPSGPFLLPQALPPEEVLEHLGATAPAPPPMPPPAPPEEVVVEPSGPFVMPGGPPAPVVAFDKSEGRGEEPPPVPTGVVGVAHPGPRRAPVAEPVGPSIVVEPMGRRAEATIELPRELRQALTQPPRASTSWTWLALAFAAGMLAGAAIAVAVLKM